MKPENERTLMETNRLVKDRSQKSGSIQERSLNKFVPGNSQQKISFTAACVCFHYHSAGKMVTGLHLSS